jgi:hypothetical protein
MNINQRIENPLELLSTGFLSGAVYGLTCSEQSARFADMQVVLLALRKFMRLGMYAAYSCAGVFGPYGLSGAASRRVDAELKVVQWQNGDPVTVFPETAASVDPIWPPR